MSSRTLKYEQKKAQWERALKTSVAFNGAFTDPVSVELRVFCGMGFHMSSHQYGDWISDCHFCGQSPRKYFDIKSDSWRDRYDMPYSLVRIARTFFGVFGFFALVEALVRWVI